MKDKLIKVSVLVPIYKVEKYLCRCIDSVLEQDFREYELVLVDDGSPDGCPEICDEYQTKYPDIIKVIHKQNGGLPSARLAGFEVARGEYLMFVDSDDYLAPHSMAKLYEKISEGYDFVRGQIVRENIITGEQWKEKYFYDDVEIDDNYDYFLSVIMQTNPPYLHSGIYRKNLFETSMFQKLIEGHISVGEDWLLNLAISDRVMKYARIDIPVYYYCVNTESMINTTMSSYAKMEKDEMVLTSLTNHFPDSYKIWIINNRITAYLVNFFWIENGYSNRIYKKIREYICVDENYNRLRSCCYPKHVRFIRCQPLFFIYTHIVAFLYFVIRQKCKRKNLIY